MNELSASRVEQVWSRLAGCYGEGLARKFGDLPPPEWKSAISELNDYQLSQGMRRLKFSGKPHVPSLPEFLKLCRTIGHADDVPDRPAPPKNLALEGPQLGPWEMLANRRLMKYISTVVSADPQRYGRPASWQGMKTSTEPNADASQEFVRAVGIIVGFKNRWLEVMLDSATDEGVPIPEQEHVWNECMRMAEQAIKA